MPDKDPIMNLNLSDGKIIELGHNNTTLYTFLGKTTIGDIVLDNESVNHVFVTLPTEEGEESRGIYFFERFHHVYKAMSEFAITYSMPSIINQRTVPECDLRSYLAYVDLEQERFRNMLNEELPEDFRG